ncbi:MAG: DUF5348 domain-containing protein [Clostridiales bacterium]|nr:DUF5348 domain-containing protein [Clostridiales bacterium]
MIKYEEWLDEVASLERQIEDFFKMTKYLDQEQVMISDLMPTAETLYAQQQLERFCHELEEAYYQAKRLNADVQVSGKLKKGDNGRYWLGTEELACGRSVELLFKDKRDMYGIEYWHSGHIEHNGSKYYFSGDRNLELDGVTARIKRRL